MKRYFTKLAFCFTFITFIISCPAHADDWTYDDIVVVVNHTPYKLVLTDSWTVSPAYFGVQTDNSPPPHTIGPHSSDYFYASNVMFAHIHYGVTYTAREEGTNKWMGSCSIRVLQTYPAGSNLAGVSTICHGALKNSYHRDYGEINFNIFKR